MINIVFFAELRERLACDQVTLEIFFGHSVNDLIAELLRLQPQWQAVFAEKKWLIAVNQTMASLRTAVVDGDEVAFFPPVTGG